MFSIITRIIFFLIFFSSEVFANCIFDSKDNKISQIELLNIQKSKSFFKNVGEFYILDQKNDKAGQQNLNLKRRYIASLKVTYEDGNSCIDNSSIRFHGDFNDHIRFLNGTPIPSIQVNLDKSNIKNITKFILLTPKSRNFDNEIFVTTLYEELGFLTPRTFKVKVKINNILTEYIFQEKLKKEFLEYNSRIEGPILESSEDMYNFNIFQLSKVSNSEWIKDNKMNKLSTLQALRFYNNILIKSQDFFTYDTSIRFDPNDFDDISFKNINEFDALTQAVDADHLMRFNNRKFYFDSFKETIEPIYYDGSSNILSVLNYHKIEGTYKNKLHNYLKLNKINLSKIDHLLLNYLKNYNFYELKRYIPNKNFKEHLITNSSRRGAQNIIDKINKINKENFLIKLKEKGYANINIVQLTTVLNVIVERLKLIKSSDYNDEIDFLNFKKINYENIKTKETINLIFLKNTDILNCLYDSTCGVSENKLENIEIEICDTDLVNCKFKIVDNITFKNLVEQRDITNNYDIFMGMKKDEYLNGAMKNYRHEINNKFKETVISENLKLLHSPNVKIEKNIYDKKLTLIYDNSLSKVVIYSSTLHDLEIEMKKADKGQINNYKKTNNLTGCLTILDTTIKNLSIKADNFFCEDTVNFIRSSGTIKKISISNAFGDAIDADFSELKFNEIDINSANNDCLDLSFGNYEVKKILLKSCGDKGISIGERSNFVSNQLIVKNSNTGISSKDGSIATINNADISDVNTCVSSFKKKQEFNGGNILFNKFNCSAFQKKHYTDKFSKIVGIN